MMRQTVTVLLVWIHVAWAFISPGRPLAIINSDRMRILAPPPIPNQSRGGFPEPKNSATLLPSSVEIFGKHKKNLRDEEKVEDRPSSVLDRFRKNPGSLVVAPFVLLFALDIVANILVVTKRSIEVLFTG
eukprot:CAMPEP_0198301610 /NCGR_PEP_ID=MMETSP1449-20131203/52274_1 /TAXON_ID=420275 /ORGANISM="Attheya septentrionalis, Strain CCMP2084" /LENGTH=129 /DNA_ID=CAMNT_0044003729 /DNA_START=168 /DNA_END=554 /DNA_ORIENTATION=+